MITGNIIMNLDLQKKARVLLYDIETTAYQGYFFSLYNDRGIPHTFISKEKSIISIAYKWWGESETYVISTADFPKNLKADPFDDKKVLEAFAPILEQANYLVGHYSDKFDNKFIQARAIMNNLPPLKIPTQIDTHKLAKKHFLFASNKLDYIAGALGLPLKFQMGANDWVGCMNGNKEAIKKMADYNKQDVIVLENVLNRLLPHVESKINLHLFKTEDCLSCPSCGSERIYNRGYRYQAKGIYREHSCADCLKKFKGEKVNPLEV
jgi:predicted RecB family nuclease